MKTVLGTFTLAGAVLALALTAPAFAQPGGGGGQAPPRGERLSREERQKQRAEARARLVEALQLKTDQKVKVEALLAERDQTRETLMERARSGERSPEAFQKVRDELDKANAEIDKKLAAVLTAEQLAIYQKHVEEARRQWGRAGQGRGRREGGGGGGTGGTGAGGGNRGSI